MLADPPGHPRSPARVMPKAKSAVDDPHQSSTPQLSEAMLIIVITNVTIWQTLS